MRSFANDHPGRAALPLTALLVLVASRTAVAQDAVAKPAPDSAPPAQTSAPPEAEPKPVVRKGWFGPVERLPPDAYPATPIRGLYGGSLWLQGSFHGLQWPYYPKTGIGVSGYAWIDSGYEHISRGNSTEQGEKDLIQQGRFVLRVTPTWSDGTWFAQAQAELVANEDQLQTQPAIVAADDMWIKVGNWGTFDLQAGRYEGWEIYHFGMGLDQYTLERKGAFAGASGVGPPSIYGVTYALYRPASIGDAAIHLYPTKYLRFELGTQFGNESLQNGFAGRPVGVLDLGWMKLKLGAEYKELTSTSDGAKARMKEWGYGGALQFIVDPYVEFGVNAAFGFVDSTDTNGTHSNTGSNSTYSLGAFLNARIVPDLLIGGGLDYTFQQDQQYDSSLRRYEDFDQWQGFGAIQYLLWKQLFIKAVFGYALGNLNPNNGSRSFANEMLSGRLRLLFLF